MEQKTNEGHDEALVRVIADSRLSFMSNGEQRSHATGKYKSKRIDAR
jgi:hypothetical protein